LDQQAAESGAIDKQVALDHLAGVEAQAFHEARRGLRAHIQNLALDPLHADHALRRGVDIGKAGLKNDAGAMNREVSTEPGVNESVQVLQLIFADVHPGARRDAMQGKPGFVLNGEVLL